MIDLKYIKNNSGEVKRMLTRRGVEVDVDALIASDNKRLSVLSEVENLRAERNQISKEDTPENRERGKGLKVELKELEGRLKVLEGEIGNLHEQIPNLLHPDVPEGKDESGNVEIRKWGEPTALDFEPKDHLELGRFLDLIDTEAAATVSGSRFGYLKNEAVLLEFALVQLAMKTLVEAGFSPLVPPVLIKKEISEKLGYWHGVNRNEYYMVTDPEDNPEGLYLVGTAEHAVAPMYKENIFEKKELPKRFVAFSTSFRREAGSYGKDTKGIFRVHQFDKVEMVSFTTPDESDNELAYFLSLEEELFQALEIPYRVMDLCSADLSLPAARTFDIEAWIPSEGRYREVTSASTTTDYQARRLNTRYRDGDQRRFVHIQNGTGFAIGRTIIAILENYQQEDGSVKVPEVLRPYLNKDFIRRK